MNKTRFASIAALLAGLAFAGNLLAQNSPTDGAAPSIRYSPLSSAGSDAPTDSQTSAGRPETQYAPALDGSGLISMDRTRAIHLLLGSTAGLGWDTNPDNLGSPVSTGVYTLSPYLGVQSSTPQTQIVAQYQPTFTRYTSSAYSAQTIQIGSFHFLTNLSERWSLDGNAYGSYGKDSVRFLGPEQNVAVGGVPGTGANSAAYLANAGTSTNISGVVGAHYKLSERDNLSLAMTNTFSRYASLGGENSVALTTVSFDHGLSRRLAFVTYGQGAFYYGKIQCQGVGGGVGIRWRFQQGSYLALSGGPQYDTSACKSQQGMSFDASLGTKLTGRSQIYFLASRQPTVSYLGGGLWQTSVAGGYQRQVGVRGALSFDVSHVSSSALATAGAYSGTYFDASFARRLAHGLVPSLNYRGYSGTSSGVGINRNLIMFSIAWSPEAGHIFQ